MRRFNICYKLNDGSYFNEWREGQHAQEVESVVLSYLHSNQFIKVHDLEDEDYTRFVSPSEIVGFTIESNERIERNAKK